MLVSKTLAFAVFAGTLLAGCAVTHEPIRYDGPVAPPQVVYRIDDHRYFEIVPKKNHACFPARLHYVDRERGIRTDVTSWNLIEASVFVLDAASDQYLITPIINPQCETGGGDECMPRLRYSVDAGRTWHIGKPRYLRPGGDVYLVGDTVYYADQRARAPDLGSGVDAWTNYPLTGSNKLPPLDKPPIDTRMHCDRSKTITINE